MTDEKKPDNVIQLNTSAGEQQELPLQAPEQEVLEKSKHEMLLQLVEKNRFRGAETIEKKLDSLGDRDRLEDPKLESAVRDLTAGLGGALTSLEALNSLMDFIKHDLINAIQNLAQQARGNFQASAHLQTLIKVLEDKGVITDEVMRETWEGLMKNVKVGQPVPTPAEEPTSSSE